MPVVQKLLLVSGIVVPFSLAVFLLGNRDVEPQSNPVKSDVETVDTAPPRSTEQRMFHVKHLAAVDVAEAVRSAGEAHLHALTVDEQNNTIWVEAEPAVMDDIGRVVAVMDDTSSGPYQATRVVTLRNARPSTVESALTRIFGTRPMGKETLLR